MNVLRQELGRVLKEEKERLGFSYDFIVEHTGIPKTSLRYILNSNGSVGLDMYDRLLSFFNKGIAINLTNLEDSN